MATADPATVHREPGILIASPTTNTGSAPFGGAALGLTFAHEVDMIDAPTLVPAEEFGGAPVEGIEGGKWLVFSAIFRGWDNDAIQRLFPNTSLDTTRKILAGTSQSVRAGHLLSERAFPLLFAPNDTTNHRAIYMPRVLPLVSGESKSMRSILREQMIHATFVAIPNASGRVYDIDILSRITIP